MVSYFRLFRKSFGVLRKNKVLFLPHAAILLLQLAVIYLLLFYSGIMEYVSSFENMMMGSGIFLIFLKENFIRISFFVFLYILFVLLSDSYLIAVKYGMIRDIIRTGKTSLISGLRYGKKKYTSVLSIHALCLGILFIPLLLLGVIIYLLIKHIGIAGILPSILLIVLSLVYFIFVSFRLVFLYPVMALEEKNNLSCFQIDFHYVKTHTGHTLVSWIIVVGVLLGMQYLGTLSRMNLVFSISIIILVLSIEVLAMTFEHLFIFYAYLEGKKSEKSKKKPGARGHQKSHKHLQQR